MKINDKVLLDIVDLYGKTIKELKHLYVNDTMVTKEGLKLLMQQIPELEVIYSYSISVNGEKPMD